MVLTVFITVPLEVLSLSVSLELQGKWERSVGAEVCFSAPVASIPSEQMALSGISPWLAGPRAAVLFPDPGFQAGVAEAGRLGGGLGS